MQAQSNPAWPSDPASPPPCLGRALWRAGPIEG